MSQDKVRKILSSIRIVERPRRPVHVPGINLKASIKPHHLRWSVGKYREDFSFGPGGQGRKRVWVPRIEGEQHNIILDAAYDLVASYGFLSIHYYAAVGTGTTPPATTDTTLVNEVARTSTLQSGRDDPETTRIADAQYNIITYRQFSPTLVGGQNLTEWGFSPTSGAGTTLMSRELFRDGGGNPITLTVASDEYLNLDYGISVQLAPQPAQAVSMNITNIGTITGQLEWRNWTSGTDDLNVANMWVQGYAHMYIFAYNDTQHYSGYSVYSKSSTYSRVTPTPQSYVSGSRQRLLDVEFGINDANFTIYRFIFAETNVNGYVDGGLVFELDAGSEITKDSTHKLVFDPWTLSW